MFNHKTLLHARALQPLSLGGPKQTAAPLTEPEANPLESILEPVRPAEADYAGADAIEASGDLPVIDVSDVEDAAVAEPLAEPVDNSKVTFKADLAPDAFSARPSKPPKARAGREVPPSTKIEQPSKVMAKKSRAETSVSGAPAPLPVWARWAYPVAACVALSWAGALIAFCFSFKDLYGPFEYRPFPIVIFASLALLPSIFILLAAYVFRQAARMAVETRRARDMASELSLPMALAANQAGGAAEAVRMQIEKAGSAAETAERQLLSLRQALADESQRLIAATEDAGRAAETLTAELSREREEMSVLAAGLEGQASAVADAISRQTRMVTEASDLAAVQLQEAEAALAARATDLAIAAGEAGEAAELAGEALAKQAERIEMSGDRVAAKLDSAGERLSTAMETTRLSLISGHEQLSELAARLEADQEHLAGRLERQRESIAAAAAYVQVGAAALAEASETGAASLRDLIAEASEQVRILAETAQSEQAALDARARATLNLFTGAVAEERAAIETQTQMALAALAAAAEETRLTAAQNVETSERAAAAQAEAARAQVEQLGEAAFAAGQKADQAFDARISAARKTIEASAALVEEAGQKSVERVDAGLALARQALSELETLMAGVDGRLAAAPEQARARAESVRLAVEASLELITAAARKAANETQSVDAAFQERVKRNYETLSEALRTMGKVASAVEQTAQTAPRIAAPPPTPAAASPTARATFADAPFSVAVNAAAANERVIHAPGVAPSFTAPPPPPARAGAMAEGSDLGLRPRLKLSPGVEAAKTAVQDEPVLLTKPAPRIATPAPEPAPMAPAPVPARDGGWTWKDLLSSIDEPPIDDEVLAERLISEIEALGLDAAALLPLTRIDEIAAVMQAGDGDGVRAVVRQLAPGAVRRLSRRVLTDKVLRSHADRYVRRYEDLLHDSQRRDREGFMTAALLGSGPGRAFLLFDAAVGELH